MIQRCGLPAADILHAANVLIRDYMAVRKDEDVLVTADTATEPELIQALLMSIAQAEARGSALIIPQLRHQGRLADPYVPPSVGAAASASDVWIDVTFPYLAGSRTCDEVMQQGKLRYLLGGDMGCEGLCRLFGTVDLDAYYAVHSELDRIISDAVGSAVRIANRHGSEVSFRLAKPGYAKPRRAEVPGLYFVPGAVTMFPEPGSAQGVLYLVAGFHDYYGTFAEPAMLDVDGTIRSIRGGGAQRAILERALRRATSGGYGEVIHFTHGIHPAARMSGQSFIEDMRTLGTDAVGLGIPFWLPGGGENHPDVLLIEQSLWIDGRKVAEDGMLIDPPRLAKSFGKLLQQ